MGREEGSGWGTHIYLWQIHFNIWQNQYNIVKFKNKIKFKKKILLVKKKRERERETSLVAQMVKNLPAMLETQV